VEQTGTGTDDGSGSAGKREPAGAENALDTLLDELETTPAVASVAATTAVVTESVESASAVEPTVEATAVTAPVTGPAVAIAPKPVLRRLSSTSSEAGAKPPVPERTPDLQNKRMPPPPPPRTSSKSPVASPTTAGSAVGAPTSTPRGSVSSLSTGGSPPSRKGSLTTVALSGYGKPPMPEPPVAVATAHQQLPPPAVPTAVATATRQEQLEQRHQELLKKQKALQEQYTRLQQLQRSQPPPDLLQLKKTGSEGNLLLKMGLSMSAAAPISGSLTQLAAAVTTSATATAADENAAAAAEKQRSTANNKATAASTTKMMTVSKVYETDII